jgi:hypothetical protein
MHLMPQLSELWHHVPIDSLPIDKRYIIIGSPKCGTRTLLKFLRKRGYDIVARETWCLKVERAEIFPYDTHIPILITRNPIERAWSDMQYFYSTYRDSILNNCTMWSEFRMIASMWSGICYSLEYVMNLPDMIHMNPTNNKQPMPKDFKEKVIKELKLHKA